MEKMVKERLVYNLDIEAKLYNWQTGFKKYHSTHDSILKLESIKKEIFLKNQFTIAFFIDLKKLTIQFEKNAWKLNQSYLKLWDHF